VLVTHDRPLASEFVSRSVTLLDAGIMEEDRQ
jgi:hypothetical protein